MTPACQFTGKPDAPPRSRNGERRVHNQCGGDRRSALSLGYACGRGKAKRLFLRSRSRGFSEGAGQAHLIAETLTKSPVRLVSNFTYAELKGLI